MILSCSATCTQICDFITPLFTAKFFTLLFLAILFVQSGLDKVLDWNGNLSWLKEHFSKTAFKSLVPFLLLKLTGMELLAGVLCAIGVIAIFFNCNYPAYLGLVMSGFSVIALFIGQRVAKDYVGAASLIGYFLVILLGLYLFSL